MLSGPLVKFQVSLARSVGLGVLTSRLMRLPTPSFDVFDPGAETVRRSRKIRGPWSWLQ